MKTEQITFIIGICLSLLILPSLVKASVSCQKEYYINGTAYINDTCVLNDEELEQDVYGNLTGSGPKDMVLDEIGSTGGNPIIGTQGLDSINEVCDQPYLQQYLKNMGSLPPQEFVDYVKSLGYDDEAHITLIWSMCQDRYVSSHESEWSKDDSGIDTLTVVQLIGRSVDWLLGNNELPSKNEVTVARKLDSYFASDKDVYYLNNKMSELQLRLEALERTIQKTQADAYCQGKLDMMKDYNMEWVKCGDTTYHNHLKDPVTGEDMVVTITPIDNTVTNSVNNDNNDHDGKVDNNTITCSDVGKCKNTNCFCTSYDGINWCGFENKEDWYRANCIRKV